MAERLIKADEYNDRENKAVFSVLTELAQIIGTNNKDFVLVGGSVPSLLFPDANPPHAGTLDIDLNLNPNAQDGYGYNDLVKNLEDHGYERGLEGLKPFQMLRTIDVGDGSLPIPIIIDLLRPSGSDVKEHDPKLNEGLKIQEIDGGRLAIEYSQEISIDGIMPDGSKNKVTIHIPTIPAYLVMKGYALAGRYKLKDAYDIWFCIRNYEGGIENLANACKPLLDDDEAIKAYKIITDKFRSEDDYGPDNVRKYLENSPEKCGDMTLDQIQTDAYARVSKWCQILGLKI